MPYDDIPAPTGGGDKFTLSEHAGAAVLLDFAGIKTDVETEYGTKDAASFSTIRVIGEDGAIADTYSDVLIFNAGVLSRFNANTPKKTYRAMVGTYTTGKGTFYAFEPADEKAAAAISRHEAADTKAPF